ncbi:hypothetical protein NL676_038322 [Syzygium grande]|nr:hypothetical protein NL676_038322 [Syzygium grande]
MPVFDNLELRYTGIRGPPLLSSGPHIPEGFLWLPRLLRGGGAPLSGEPGLADWGDDFHTDIRVTMLHVASDQEALSQEWCLVAQHSARVARHGVVGGDGGRGNLGIS